MLIELGVEGFAMQIVLIACPETNELVPTGMRVSGREELAPVNVLSACPSCGHAHEWVPHEAVVTAATEEFRPLPT
jgi:hypothetical protein